MFPLLHSFLSRKAGITTPPWCRTIKQREMNKPPQPITGPTSVPNPAPSPGLTQVRAHGLFLTKLCFLFRCFCPLYKFPPSFKGLWSRTATFSCLCPPTSTNEFCTTAKTGMVVSSWLHSHQVWSVVCSLLNSHFQDKPHNVFLSYPPVNISETCCFKL